MKTKGKRSSRAAKHGAPPVSIKKFIVMYVLLMGCFFLLIGYVPLQNIVDINGLYSEGVVKVTAALLGYSGITCSSEGSLLRLPSLALDVRFGCSGLEAVMIYSVAVIAFPAPWKVKLAGIAFGFFVLQVVNVLRIGLLAYAGIHFRSVFEYLHVFVAQGIMIALALFIFLAYLRHAGPSTRSS
jgi:exosortase/archaeosortase family protein